MSDEANAALSWQLKRMGFRQPIADRLRNAGVQYVWQLAAMSPQDLLRIDYIGHITLRQIREALAEVGLRLSSDDVEETTPPKLTTPERLTAIDKKVEEVLTLVRQTLAGMTCFRAGRNPPGTNNA